MVLILNVEAFYVEGCGIFVFGFRSSIVNVWDSLFCCRFRRDATLTGETDSDIASKCNCIIWMCCGLSLLYFLVMSECFGRWRVFECSLECGMRILLVRWLTDTDVNTAPLLHVWLGALGQRVLYENCKLFIFAMQFSHIGERMLKAEQNSHVSNLHVSHVRFCVDLCSPSAILFISEICF